ncbi:MAG: UDP-N-acetylglucosamine 1-carboxyvinyltransferase [Candidatus Peribacteraceae bacterium]|nr:UDP-N-acetylglucosamine 1-carboxyvinyltransferase [Candidatus Peribacteraceae bacterium]
MSKFIVRGGRPLSGTVKISGSKNAALPLLAATLLTAKKYTLCNIPDVADVRLMLEILEVLGAKLSFANNTVEIQTPKLKTTKVPAELAGQMRASILLLGPLLARAGKAEIAFPGGCVIGKRSVHAHTYALEKLGATNKSTDNVLKFEAKSGIQPTAFNLPELSVTATENALMAASLSAAETKIRMAAYEPHVVDLCEFLKKLGVKISGVGSHTLKVSGTKNLTGAAHTTTPDYLEAGTFAIAGLLTGGKIRIENVVPKQLDSFFQKLEEVGAEFFVGPNFLEVSPTQRFEPTEIKTAVFPGFPTDLQAPFGVLLTQARGKSRIFETLFDGRLNYLFELEKMGARVEVFNPHQAVIFGDGKLRAAKVASCDLRAGAAMVLAALSARGISEVTNVEYIDRGYEKFAEKLRELGAEIERVD